MAQKARRTRSEAASYWRASTKVMDLPWQYCSPDRSA